ncbi:Uncharacterized protein ALO55_05763 [Pseudomonas savastanoi pv. phaseolicola]|uniref:Uncharacterized protein n=1 Tax=Pseudomonas savastanoi pv. phaseolicola TaxID=319 RepID=A0ABD4BDW0_PSESH|nr:Uncharacterized protein ALO55_05763 [Pseudomonas savastanoi pv. phaseolicola]
MHPQPRPPEQPGHQSDKPGHGPDHRPDAWQTDTHGQRGQWVVRHCTQRQTDTSTVEQQRQGNHQRRSRARSEQVELREQHAANFQWLVRDAQLKAVNLRPPQRLGQAFDHVRQAKGGHEQNDRWTIDQWAQNHSFDQQRQHHHAGQRCQKRPEKWHTPLQQADKRQRREQHHRALSEVEHPRRLVDQHKPNRHQRVHDTCQQPADQHFKEEFHGLWFPDRRRTTRAEIRSDYLRVGANLRGCAVPDLATVIQHHHMVAEAHHHTDVVLDQHHSDAQLTIDIADELTHLVLLFGIHSGHRLVQQQQTRFRRQGAGQFDTFLQAIGKFAHQCMAPRVDAQKLNHPLGMPALFVVFGRCPTDAQHLLKPGTAPFEIAPGQHVVQHTHALEQGDILKSTGDTALGRLVRTHPAARLAGISDGAALRLIHAIDDVEQRTLARTIGAYQCADLACSHRETD